MNPEIKAQWVDALRSGDYKQGKNVLRNSEDSFCCLGVLCDLAVKAGVKLEVLPPLPENATPEQDASREYSSYHYAWEYNGADEVLPRVVQEWAGLLAPNPVVRVDKADCLNTRLSHLNDNGESFDKIANLIERDL